MEGFDLFVWEYSPCTFPNMMLFIPKLLHNEPVGPSVTVILLSLPGSPPFSSAPGLGPVVRDKGDWRKNLLFEARPGFDI